MAETRPAPYPADTRAKGWRFELDYEQIEQSSTWALAPAEARPWLLMQWMMAWKQTPCGSLPSDEEVIAAQLGMPPRLWAKFRKVMMRGWWMADDGRLYHSTLAKRVDEMMARRRSDSDRKARERAKKLAESGETPPGVTPVSRVTPPGLPPDSSTGTGTGTKEYKRERASSPPAARARGPEAKALAERAAEEMRQAGLPGVVAEDPELLALLDQGITPAELGVAAGRAVALGKGAAYAYGTAVGKRADAVRQIASRPLQAVPTTAPSKEAEATQQLLQREAEHARQVEEQRLARQAKRAGGGNG